MRVKCLLLMVLLVSSPAYAAWDRSIKSDGVAVIQQLSNDNTSGLMVGCELAVLSLAYDQTMMNMSATVAIKFDAGETSQLEGIVMGKKSWIVLSEFIDDLVPKMKRGNNVGIADNKGNTYWFSLAGFTRGYNSLNCG